MADEKTPADDSMELESEAVEGHLGTAPEPGWGDELGKAEDDDDVEGHLGTAPPPGWGDEEL